MALAVAPDLWYESPVPQEGRVSGNKEVSMSRVMRSPFAPAFVALALAVLAVAAAPAAADLVDHGAHGEFFYDQSTGLYWFDPAAWVDAGRPTVDTFVTRAPLWAWATSAQVEALVGQTAAEGFTLEAVMGPRQFTAGADWPRWIGFHASADQPDGWLLQSTDNDSLDTSGSQSNAAAWDAGAWLVAAEDPTTAPRLTDLGGDGAYFYDAETGLYWSDPDRFQWGSRQMVADWLAVHPEWRWATADEVYGLLGKMSDGDVDLTEIMGAPQFGTAGSYPRWIGYYAQAEQPDGLLLQAGPQPYCHMVTVGGTQTNASSWNAGAWLVRTTDPTPVGETSWGDVKNRYR